MMPTGYLCPVASSALKGLDAVGKLSIFIFSTKSVRPSKSFGLCTTKSQCWADWRRRWTRRESRRCTPAAGALPPFPFFSLPRYRVRRLGRTGRRWEEGALSHGQHVALGQLHHFVDDPQTELVLGVGDVDARAEVLRRQAVCDAIQRRAKDHLASEATTGEKGSGKRKKKVAG